jgi:putative resolvase
VKLAVWARSQGIHYLTAYRWWKDGTLPVPAHQTATGMILVDARDQAAEGRVALYARVSSHDQRADLDRQVARLSQWATAQGWTIAEVVAEVGSAMNAKRVKLRRLLADRTITRIVVEHRDRLTRYGFEFLESALAASGRQIVVVDAGEQNNDLVRDVIEVLTSFCARLYGKRGARNRALRAVTASKAA